MCVHITLTFQEVFEAITKPPLNCTNGEHWSFGFKQLRCVWHNVTEPSLKNDITTGIFSLGKFLVFWLTVYAIIAITLWVVKGKHNSFHIKLPTTLTEWI